MKMIAKFKYLLLNSLKTRLMNQTRNFGEEKIKLRMYLYVLGRTQTRITQKEEVELGEIYRELKKTSEIQKGLLDRYLTILEKKGPQEFRKKKPKKRNDFSKFNQDELQQAYQDILKFRIKSEDP